MLKVMTPDMPTAADLLPYLERIDRARWYSNGGPLLAELESRLAKMMGGVPTACVANATQGLEVVLGVIRREMRLNRPPRVLVPAVTFVASARAIINAGCVPVICDVCPVTWMLTPHIAAGLQRRGAQFDIAMPVAAFGQPVDTAEWTCLADMYCAVVVDAAAGLPEQQGSMHGGIAVVSSLHATKFIGAGEGGAVAWAHDGRLAQVRRAINFGGFEATAQDWGTNAKMSEYHAAVALASLNPIRLEAKALDAGMVAQLYAKHMPAGCHPQWGLQLRRNHTLMPVLLPEGSTAAGVQETLAKRGIETRRWYAPMLHKRPELRHHALGPLPVSDSLDARLLGLPFHGFMDEEDVRRVCSELREALE